MSTASGVEIWEWAEYYCPWCYITAVRMHDVASEYRDRVKFKIRAFPLEVYGSGPAPRDILEQEWWLAALQEPAAPFAPYRGDDFPTTTLPAFEAVWCAQLQDEDLAFDLDLRIRRAFFAESRNIGRRDVITELAAEVGLDMLSFTRRFESGEAREAVLEEGRIGKEQFHVRSTPTVMLADGTRLDLPIAPLEMRNRKIVSVGPLPCYGESCRAATRDLFEQALSRS